MENEELVKLIQGGDTGQFETLWNQNTKLVLWMLRRYKDKDFFEDLIQESFLAMYDAVKAYNPNEGANFATIFCIYIKKQCFDFMSKNKAVRVPKQYYAAWRKLQQLQEETGRHYFPARYLKNTLGINPEAARNIQNGIMQSPESLNKPVLNEGTDKEVDLSETIPDAGANPEEIAVNNVFYEEQRKAVWEIVNGLDQDEKEVIAKIYKNGESVEIVAQGLGCKQSQIYAIRNRALRKLSRNTKLIQYREEILSHAYRYIGLRAFERSWTSSTEAAAMKLLGRK